MASGRVPMKTAIRLVMVRSSSWLASRWSPSAIIACPSQHRSADTLAIRNIAAGARQAGVVCDIGLPLALTCRCRAERQPLRACPPRRDDATAAHPDRPAHRPGRRDPRPAGGLRPAGGVPRRGARLGRRGPQRRAARRPSGARPRDPRAAAVAEVAAGGPRSAPPAAGAASSTSTIDLQCLTKSAVAAWLSGARRRIGKAGDHGRELSRWFHNELVDVGGRHVIDHYLEMLQAAGRSRTPRCGSTCRSGVADARTVDDFLRAQNLLPQAVRGAEPGRRLAVEDLAGRALRRSGPAAASRRTAWRASPCGAAPEERPLAEAIVAASRGRGASGAADDACWSWPRCAGGRRCSSAPTRARCTWRSRSRRRRSACTARAVAEWCGAYGPSNLRLQAQLRRRLRQLPPPGATTRRCGRSASRWSPRRATSCWRGRISARSAEALPITRSVLSDACSMGRLGQNPLDSKRAKRNFFSANAEAPCVSADARAGRVLATGWGVLSTGMGVLARRVGVLTRTEWVLAAGDVGVRGSGRRGRRDRQRRQVFPLAASAPGRLRTGHRRGREALEVIGVRAPKRRIRVYVRLFSTFYVAQVVALFYKKMARVFLG